MDFKFYIYIFLVGVLVIFVHKSCEASLMISEKNLAFILKANTHTFIL